MGVDHLSLRSPCSRPSLSIENGKTQPDPSEFLPECGRCGIIFIDPVSSFCRKNATISGRLASRRVRS